MGKEPHGRAAPKPKGALVGARVKARPQGEQRLSPSGWEQVRQAIRALSAQRPA